MSWNLKIKARESKLLAGCLWLGLSGCQTDDLKQAPVEAWQLTFSDTFDGVGRPDRAKWQSENKNRRDNPTGPDGWWDESYAKLDGEGNLILTVDRIKNRNRDDDPYDFAVGMVSTKGLFEQRYGKFEARARLPRETGWWAAFWLFSAEAAEIGDGGRDGSEIDIMEGFGRVDCLHHAVHWDGRAKIKPFEEKKHNWPGLSEGFHTYAVEWSPTEYVFFVDGIETWRTSAGGVSQVPTYIKLTGEISTMAWAVTELWAGPINPEAYPDSFVIDYVKVWSKDP